MINLTNNIIIFAKEDELRKAVEQAIKDTHRTLLSFYAPNVADISLIKITSTRNNRLKALAFNLYIPNYREMFDAVWVEQIFFIVHNHSRDDICSVPQKIVDACGIKAKVPKTLVKELWRGFRVFLLALWSQKAILLPMTFSLPSNTKGKEYASILYTEVLAIFRRPFVAELDHIPDILNGIAPKGRRNFNWYAWRPVIASDWHKVEDINERDLIALFSELGNRRRANQKNPDAPSYPLAPPSFLNPLVRNYHERCHFNAAEVLKYNPRIISPVSSSTEEWMRDVGGANNEIMKVWVNYQRRYLEQLRTVKRIKNTKCAEHDLGKLNQYLFSILPQAGCHPPLPSELGRKHIEGIGVPPLRVVLSKRDSISALERFFQYLEDIAPFESELEGFCNPILNLDKPKERKPRQTKKSTFRVRDFRMFYHLAHAIGEFAWYVAKRIGEGDAPESWRQIINNKNQYQVLDTEEFGYVPIIRAVDTDGSPLNVNLRWLPISVLPANYVRLKIARNDLSPIFDLHGIHQVIIGIETGLRQIHIRWLDKRSFIHSPVEPEAPTFDLLVNTDKVSYEWVRPTAKPVMHALERQIESQSWIEGTHFDDELYYDGHELSDFGKICPIFMEYKEAKVYSHGKMSYYFNSLVYLFNQIKVSLRQAPVDVLPAELNGLSFNCKNDFERAIRSRKRFKSKYTPHGLRATVVSVHAPVLPPHLIGELITGHVSENMVRYYTVVDSDYINDVKALNRQIMAASGQHKEALLAIRVDSKNSRLRNDVATASIADVLRDYGAFSFSSEEASGEVKSGMNTILAATQDDIVINPTHICPLGNRCPHEIVSSIGEKSCGQCYYSIKTVDHLPRILSHCRFLSRQFDHANAQLKNASNNGASEEALEALENGMVRLAGEIAAWGLTAKVLGQNYELLKDRVLVNKPEIFTNQLIGSLKPDSDLENLFVQCEEAAAYPELADSALLVDVAMARSRILAMTGSVEELFAPLDNFQLLDSFRGIFRGICIATGKSPKDLAAHIERQQDVTPAVLNALEKIYD